MSKKSKKSAVIPAPFAHITENGLTHSANRDHTVITLASTAVITRELDPSWQVQFKQLPLLSVFAIMWAVSSSTGKGWRSIYIKTGRTSAILIASVHITGTEQQGSKVDIKPKQLVHPIQAQLALGAYNLQELDPTAVAKLNSDDKAPSRQMQELIDGAKNSAAKAAKKLAKSGFAHIGDDKKAAKRKSKKAA